MRCEGPHVVKDVGLPLGVLERMPSRHRRGYYIIGVVIIGIGGYHFIGRRRISLLEISLLEGIALHRRRVFHHWRASHHRRHRSSLEDQHWSHHVISGFSIGGSALEDQHWSHRVIGGINSIIIRADPRKIEAEELVEHKRAT